jgi:hypothetical protein
MIFKYGYESDIKTTEEYTCSSILVENNIDSLDISESMFSFESILNDSFHLLTYVGTEDASSNNPWYKKAWKWVKDMLTKLWGYVLSAWKWIKKNIFRIKDNVQDGTTVSKVIEESTEKLKEVSESSESSSNDTNTTTNEKKEETISIEKATEVVKPVVEKHMQKTDDKEVEKIAENVVKAVTTPSTSNPAEVVVIPPKESTLKLVMVTFNSTIIERISPNNSVGSLIQSSVLYTTKSMTSSEIVDLVEAFKTLTVIIYGEDKGITDAYSALEEGQVDHVSGSPYVMKLFEELMKQIDRKVSSEVTNVDEIFLVREEFLFTLYDGKITDKSISKLDAIKKKGLNLIKGIVRFMSSIEEKLKDVQNKLSKLKDDEFIERFRGRNKELSEEEVLKASKELVDIYKNIGKYSTNIVKNYLKIFKSKNLNLDTLQTTRQAVADRGYSGW